MSSSHNPEALIGEDTYLGIPDVREIVALPDGTQVEQIDPQGTIDAAQEEMRKQLPPIEGAELKFVINE